MQSLNTTPTKRTSYVTIPTDAQLPDALQETTETDSEVPKLTHLEPMVVEPIENAIVKLAEKPISPISKENTKSSSELNTSDQEKEAKLKMNTEAELKETAWPDVLKCRFFDTQ